MIRPSQLLRLIHINIVLVRHGLDEIIFAIHLLRPLRFLLYFLPWNWVPRTRADRGQRIRRALEDLGPIYVKFGQMLSTREDLLPEDIAAELSKLQDSVPPFSGAEAQAIVEQAYGRPIEQVFTEFDITPMASASIAQVHAAVFRDGSQVVVKVVRPKIEKTIVRDIELLYTVAELAQRYWPQARRLRPREVVAEYEKVIIDELDLIREASNAAQLRRNFSGSELLYVPDVYWDYTRKDVMVMERICGIAVSDVVALRERGVDLKELADRGVEIFFTQVFRHNFFHADMHPGNIFVDATRPEAPRYLAVDFGIVGTLSPIDQRYLAETFHAFFNRDYRRVAQLHVESGWVPSNTRVDEFESAIRTVCEPIFQRPLKEISFGHVLLRLFQTARRFDMQVQPQLVLLQKTLLNIEGLGRRLYPELDLWQTAKPFLEQWMRDQIGPRALLTEARSRLPILIEKLPELPDLVRDVLLKASHGSLRVQWESEQIELLRKEIRRANRRTVIATLGATLIVSSFLIMGFGAEIHATYSNTPWVAWLLALSGALAFSIAWSRGS